MNFTKFTSSLSTDEKHQLHRILSDQLGYDPETQKYAGSRTHILDFLKEHGDNISPRVKNALHQYHSHYVIRNLMSPFVEDITDKHLYTLSGVGRKTWVDFSRLRNKTCYTINND